MLELLYATGMRVSEMLHLQIFDVNLQFGYVVCNENGKERIIPIGIPCKKAMERYLQTARTVFVKDEKETWTGGRYTVCQLFRRSDEPSGILESIKGICG